MSFKARLELEGKEYNIINIEYGFAQNTDQSNKPIGVPRGGKIYLSIESRGETDFLDWMVSSTQTKKGKIVFYKPDEHMSILFKIQFEDAYCVDFTEYFSSTDKIPMLIKMTISARKLDFGNVTYENKWIKV